MSPVERELSAAIEPRVSVRRLARHVDIPERELRPALEAAGFQLEMIRAPGARKPRYLVLVSDAAEFLRKSRRRTAVEEKSRWTSLQERALERLGIRPAGRAARPAPAAVRA